jgi:hypothetical protein
MIIHAFNRRCHRTASAISSTLMLFPIALTIGNTPAAQAADRYCSDIVASDSREAGTNATKVVDGTMFQADTRQTASVGSGDSTTIAQGTVQSPTSSVSGMNFNQKSYDFATATENTHVEGASGLIKQQNSQYQKQSTAKVVGQDCRAAVQLEMTRETSRTQLKLAEMQQRGKLVDMLMR